MPPTNDLMNGVGLNVVRLGTTGPRVVMSHGLLLGNLATWYFGAAPALAVDHRVVLYDLRGHGRSERPATGYDLDTLSADLGAVVGDEPAALVGHSWGGLIALRFARDHRHLVRSLTLVDTPLPPSTPESITTFLDQPVDQALAALPPALAAAVAGGGRAVRRLRASLDALLGHTTLLADLAATPPIPEAELTHLPRTTLIYGQRSGCLASGHRLAALIPGARLHLLDGGHWLHLDAPEALAAAVREAVLG